LTVEKSIVGIIIYNTSYYVLLNIFVLLILLKCTTEFKFSKIDLSLVSIWILFNLNFFYLAAAVLIRFHISIFLSVHIILVAGIMYSLVSSAYHYVDWTYWPIEIGETYLSNSKSYINILSEHSPYFEEVISNFNNYSNLILTSVNSINEIPLFNLSLDNLKVKQEFLSDYGRLKFSGIVIDNSIISLLAAVIFFLVFAYTQAIRYFIIKC
jgi:hypothetical protein